MRDNLKRKEVAEAVTLQATMKRVDLLRAVKTAAAATARRVTVPVLANLLIESTPDGLTLTGCDLEIWATAACQADVGMPGAVTVPARELERLLCRMDCDTLSMSVVGDLLHIAGGDDAIVLNTIQAVDFPAPAKPEFTHRFTLAAADLRKMLEKTRGAISCEATRYYLNGVYLHVLRMGTDLVLRAVATDGHRMYLCDTPAPDGAENMQGIIVPRGAVKTLLKMCADDPVVLSVSAAGGKPWLMVTCGGGELLVKTIDGTFPDYARVIPNCNDKSVIVETAALRRAVEVATAISREQVSPVKIDLQPGLLIMSHVSHDNGTASRRLFVSYAGAPIEIGFRASYLRDIFDVAGERIEMAFSYLSGPAIMTDPEDASVKFVLLPMRIS